MSADRFWAILFPMNYMVRKDSGYRKWVIIICIAFGLMSGYYYGAHECIRDGGVLNCVFDVKFFLEYEKFFCSWAGIGFILLVFFNSSIVWAVLKRVSLVESNAKTDFHKVFLQRRSSQKMVASKTAETNFQKRYQEEIRIATTMMMIILSFVLCWLPFSFRCFCQAITQNRKIYEDFLKEKYGEHVGFYLGRILSSVSFSLTSLNSLIDPLIYAFRMKDVRTAIINIVTCKREESEPHTGSSYLMNSLRSMSVKFRK
jgi:7 transmembrane receptor (rhodopsin family)